jgi:uncharacterized protein YeeX (DUF496 family)
MLEYSTKAEIMKGILEIVKLLRENNKLTKELLEKLKGGEQNAR